MANGFSYGEICWIKCLNMGLTQDRVISKRVDFKILSRCREIQFGNGVNGPTKEKESSSLSGQPIFILTS